MPLITLTNEGYLLDEIKRHSAQVSGSILALNCVADHVHVAVSIPPNQSVAQWVSRVKGGSSHSMNQSAAGSEFRWQDSYGVLTFGAKNLPMVTEYIENQKQHHRENTLYEYLERTEE